MVFALVNAYNYIEFIYGYNLKSNSNQRTKQIIKPIPGKYHEEMHSNIFLQEELFEPFFTDENGKILVFYKNFMIYF